MVRLLGFITFLTIVICQQLPSDVKTDILNIIYNSPVALRDCSKTVVALSNLQFILYSQDNQQKGININNTNIIDVNPKHRLIFIIHGWLQSGMDNWISEMRDAYLKQTAANIIAVDWSFYTGINYASSYCAVPQVGSFVGNLIYSLVTAERAQLQNIQINGFSLGAHVAGFAGQEVQNKTGGSKIERINGLDAAGPGFLGLPIDKRLDKSDATFVQGIHTSNYQFGYSFPYATVDFQVNFKKITGCGAIQPGCPFIPGVPRSALLEKVEEVLPYIFCNHVRVLAYFTESIHSTFSSISCAGCNKFGLVHCVSNQTAVMGENCPSNVSGEYYLITNAKFPFARGLFSEKVDTEF